MKLSLQEIFVQRVDPTKSSQKIKSILIKTGTFGFIHNKF